jgi:hypothetical protein
MSGMRGIPGGSEKKMSARPTQWRRRGGRVVFVKLPGTCYSALQPGKKIPDGRKYNYDYDISDDFSGGIPRSVKRYGFL